MTNTVTPDTPPVAPPVRPLAELIEAASQARCGQCWAEPGAACTTLPTLDVPDPSPLPDGGVHVARVGRAMRRGLLTGNELLAVLGTLDAFAPATVVCGQVPDEAGASATELTRAEAAYARLASFRRGELVEVDGRAARVVCPQQPPPPGRGMEEACLLVTGYGTETCVTVRDLLSGGHAITPAIVVCGQAPGVTEDDEDSLPSGGPVQGRGAR
jgi:hypothetical protein